MEWYNYLTPICSLIVTHIIQDSFEKLHGFPKSIKQIDPRLFLFYLSSSCTSFSFRDEQSTALQKFILVKVFMYLNSGITFKEMDQFISLTLDTWFPNYFKSLFMICLDNKLSLSYTLNDKFK